MDTSRSEVREFKRNDVNPAVRGFIHPAASPAKYGLVLAHGAGSNCESPLLIKLATAFCDFGYGAGCYDRYDRDRNYGA